MSSLGSRTHEVFNLVRDRRLHRASTAVSADDAGLRIRIPATAAAATSLDAVSQSVSQCD
jgi:hypothetical protein